MEYNEKQFKALANIRVMIMWASIALVLTTAYIIEFLKAEEHWNMY